jgi:hypothetical protein
MPENQPPTPPSPSLKVLPETVELSSGDVQAFSVSNTGLVVEWSTEPPAVGEIDKHGNRGPRTQSGKVRALPADTSMKHKAFD